MIKIICQKNKDGHYVPWSAEDKEQSGEIKDFQLVQCRISGIGAKKERSVIALNLLMACCQLVADNTEERHWNTKEKVKFQIKVATNFIDASKTIVDRQGNVHLHYRSFSFDELPHMESVRLFDQAYDILADHIGITVDELIAAAKEKMLSR